MFPCYWTWIAMALNIFCYTATLQNLIVWNDGQGAVWAKPCSGSTWTYYMCLINFCADHNSVSAFGWGSADRRCSHMRRCWHPKVTVDLCEKLKESKWVLEWKHKSIFLTCQNAEGRVHERQRDGVIGQATSKPLYAALMTVDQSSSELCKWVFNACYKPRQFVEWGEWMKG